MIVRGDKRRAAPRRESSSGSGDDWMLTYADAITLLMAFFVVLLALSDKDTAKYEEVANAIAAQISHEPAEPIQGLEKGAEGFADTLASTLSPLQKDDQVSVETSTETIIIELSGTLLYGVGSAEIRPEALDVLNQVAEILQATELGEDHVIIVEGHTDDVPISRGPFPSNWELSAARATAVVRHFASQGVPQDKLRAMAMADTQPLVPNLDPEGNPIPENRAKNRRVVVRVER